MEIAVADVGRGIPAEESERIFLEFQQSRGGYSGPSEEVNRAISRSAARPIQEG